MNRARALSAVRRAFALAERERRFMIAELSQVKGLMPLLMKPRNKQKWTAQDKAELRAQLKRLSNLSPYLVALVMPGGFAVLPVLAWWLDRRRGRRDVAPARSH